MQVFEKLKKNDDLFDLMFMDVVKESEQDKEKIYSRGAAFTSENANKIESNFLNAKQVIFIG